MTIMYDDDLLKEPGAVLDDRDERDPEFSVDPDLSEQAAHGQEHDPLA